MTTVNTSKFAHLAGYQGDEMDTQDNASFGVPYLQFFNASQFHIDTEIEKGGWGIKSTEQFTPPPIGPIQTINHQGGRSSNMAVTNQPLEMALIWWAGPYVRWWPSGDKSKAPNLIHQDFLFKSMHKEHGGAAETGMSIFVVLKCDESRSILEIPAKTFAVDDWLRIITLTRKRVGVMAEFMKKAGELPKDAVLPIYSQWIKVGVGGNSQEGNADKTNIITHPEIAWPGLEVKLPDFWKAAAYRKVGKAMICDPDKQWSHVSQVLSVEDLAEFVPSDEDMAKFAAMRQDLATRNKSGFRAINAPVPDIIAKMKNQALALAAPSEPSMPDDEPTAQTTAPVVYDANGNEVKAAAQSLGDEVKADQSVANKFFSFVMQSFNIKPPEVLKILGAKSLTNVAMTQDEALAAIEQHINKVPV